MKIDKTDCAQGESWKSYARTDASKSSAAGLVAAKQVVELIQLNVLRAPQI